MSTNAPIGVINEITGDATITRNDGTSENLSIGSPVYQGDIVDTAPQSAVNISFTDESEFAISENTNLTIDEYVFDPVTEGGEQNFSLNEGIFVYTSGLIGRADPDDVTIDTPIGSIGIRGTIIAGDLNTGEITVVEGAIVLRDPSGNEMTLANQYETARFGTDGQGIENIGQKTASQINTDFGGMTSVAPNFFSSINDAANENGAGETDNGQDGISADGEAESQEEGQQDFDADGATDQDGDGDVDGTVDEASAQEQSTSEAKDAEIIEIDLTSRETDSSESTSSFDTIGERAFADSGSAQPQSAADTMRTLFTSPTIIASSAPVSRSSEPVQPIGDTGAPITHYTEISNPDNYSIAPVSYFFAAEETIWSYTFANDFSNNVNGGYTLSDDTKTALQQLNTQNVLDNNLSTGQGWDFDSTSGTLTLDFSAAFETRVIGGDIGTFDIEISASNDAGTITPSPYEFTLVSEHKSIGVNVSTSFLDNLYQSGDDVVLNQSGSAPAPTDNTISDYFTLGSVVGENTTLHVGSINNVKYTATFLGDGDDSVVIYDNSNIKQSNIFNLGEGDNKVTTYSGANTTDNIFTGGSGTDIFTAGDVENHYYGMGGDDYILLDLDSTDALTKLASLTSAEITLDGGGQTGNNTKLSDGDTVTGDILYIAASSSQNLDFTNIDDEIIKGIEHLDLSDANADINLTLSYSDVIEMTDENNTLVITADSGDTINLDGFLAKGFTIGSPDQNDITLTTNDAQQGGTDTSIFDVYTDGVVTLVIENTNATVIAA